jgi:hypothetical protein
VQWPDNYELVTFTFRIKLHGQWGPRGGRFIEAGSGFSGVLLGSRTLRWMMPRTDLGDVVLRRRLYLAVKPFHMGVDVDGLAYPLHCPMVCSHQMRG